MTFYSNSINNDYLKNELLKRKEESIYEIDGIIIKEINFPDESKLMYKAASGSMEYINIFQV